MGAIHDSSTLTVTHSPLWGALSVIPCALAGILVAIFCFLVPLLHFILGPFGPLVGGFVAGNLCNGGLGKVTAVSLLMSFGLAIPTAAITDIFGAESDPSTIAKLAPYVVFVYTGVFSLIGGVVSMMVSKKT